MDSWDGVLVRFGEIGVKSPPVRRSMVQRLRNNLLQALLREGVEGGVEVQGSRLFLAGPDAAALAQAARRVFGVVSVSLCRVVEPDPDVLAGAAVDLALGQDWGSFAVRATREGGHPFTSRDVAVRVGAAVQQAAVAAGRSGRVDLDAPDLEVHVEVRDRRAYVYCGKLGGPGGLPVGSQGRVLALLSDADSALAAWLMLRRGCSVVALHAGPEEGVWREHARHLVRWGLDRRAWHVPAGEGADRASVVGTGGRVARRMRAVAMVTGEGLEGGLAAAPPGVPVLRPLCALAPEERERWRDVAGLPVAAGAGTGVGREAAVGEDVEAWLRGARRLDVSP